MFIQPHIYSALFAMLGTFLSASFAGTTVRSLLLENRLEEAVSACRQIEVLATNDTDNSLACAWVYYRSDRDEDAEKILQKTRKSFSLPEYQLLVGFGKLKKKQYEEASKIFINTQNENKGTAIGITASELNAETYEAQGNLDTAAFIYKQVVGEDPTRARAHWGLGRYYLARGDHFRAQSHLLQATKAWPKHIGSRLNLAVLALTKEDTAGAFRYLSQCYTLNKADVGVLEQLGVLFEKTGKMNEAIKYWQRAADLNPNTAVIAKEKLSTYLVQVIDSLVEARRYDEALAKIESSGKSVSDEPKLLLRRGLIYKNLGKFEKAVSDLNSYLKTNESDGSAHRELAICYINQRLPDLALEQIQKAIQYESNSGMNFAWLAYLQEGRGHLEKAREAWNRALQYLKEPADIQRATRRITTIEKKLDKRDR